MQAAAVGREHLHNAIMPLSALLRPAWRSLRRSPAFTITASTTLVIGIGAAVAIFALVNGVLLRPLPYGDPDRLVGAWHEMPGVNLARGNQTSATYFTYQRLARSIDGIGVYQSGAVNLSDERRGAEPQRVGSASVSATLIPVLQVTPTSNLSVWAIYTRQMNSWGPGFK